MTKEHARTLRLRARKIAKRWQRLYGAAVRWKYEFLMTADDVMNKWKRRKMHGYGQ